MSGSTSEPHDPSATPGHVWVDGRILPADGPHLSVFDRGFQLGDGIFETLRVRGARATELAEHIARLRSSAAGLDIDLPSDLDEVLGVGIADLLVANGLDGPAGDASVRITVSRGAYRGRGLLPPDETVAPTIAFLVRRGPGDVEELATPSLDCAILPGTTRSWLLVWAARAGLRPIEGRLSQADLASADEAFLSSSVAGVLPVTSFEGDPIGDGRPGPWTLRARADREAMIAGEDAT